MLIYNVDQIVRFIIEYDQSLAINLTTNFIESDLSQKKLQMLLYYTQGHHLSQFKKPLFKEKIIKGRHGVLINEYISEKYTATDVRLKESDFLENVIYYYNRLSPWFLRDLIKTENNGINPWSKTENGQEISHELMQKYFAMPEFANRILD